MREKLKKALYLMVAAAFFAVPWLFPATRDYAPGTAVFAGIIVAVTLGNPFAKVTGKLTSTLLGATIVGMGCGMNLIEVLKAGASGFLYTVIGISAGIGLGIVIGKKLGLQKNTMYLISVGTGICGGSAIAAAAPVLKARAHDIAIASATVFSLNAIALLVFPAVGHMLNFSENQFGYFAALAIHDTSSVVGACFQYGAEALDAGTTVKLARALWIVPVTLFLSIFVTGSVPGEKRQIKFKIPWFIPGFIAAAALVTFFPAAAPAGGVVKDISKFMMVATLFLIGSNLSREKLKELGLKPFLHGTILWVILSAGWCAAIGSGLVHCTR